VKRTAGKERVSVEAATRPLECESVNGRSWIVVGVIADRLLGMIGSAVWASSLKNLPSARVAAPLGGRTPSRGGLGRSAPAAPPRVTAAPTSATVLRTPRWLVSADHPL